MVNIDKRVGELYPGVCFGVLCIQGFQAAHAEEFAALKRSELDAVTSKYADYERKAFAQTDPACHYVRYYKGFKKTYHVLLQLESILLKGKSLPDADPLVQALFLTEVKHSLLIAGHDLDTIVPLLTIFAAQGGELFTNMTGQVSALAADDICMRDGKDNILSIIYGQDQRTRLQANTSRAMYLIDGVAGVSRETMQAGLADLLTYVRVFDPYVEVTFMDVLMASGVGS